MLIGQSLHWSEYRTAFQLCPGNSSRAWIMKLFYVDKQKQQGLKALLSLSHSLTKTHTPTHTQGNCMIHSREAGTDRTVGRVCDWWCTSPSHPPFPTENFDGRAFVCDTVGCICSIVSPQTQQASWSRPRFPLCGELRVLQLWTFCLDSAKLPPPLWAKEVIRGMQWQDLLLVPQHLTHVYLGECGNVFCLIRWQGGNENMLVSRGEKFDM